MNVRITVDSKGLEKGLTSLQRELIPKAMSNSINTIMLKGQSEQLTAMGKAFTIRRSSYAKRNIKFSPFSKPSTLSGTIQVAGPAGKVSVFEKFEKGGRYGATSSANKAVPTSHVRPDKSKVIPASKRPRNLKNTFREGNRIMQRIGKGKRERVELAYNIASSVTVKPSLNFVTRITKIAQQEWEPTARAELVKAIAKAGL